MSSKGKKSQAQCATEEIYSTALEKQSNAVKDHKKSKVLPKTDYIVEKSCELVIVGPTESISMPTSILISENDENLSSKEKEAKRKKKRKESHSQDPTELFNKEKSTENKREKRKRNRQSLEITTELSNEEESRGKKKRKWHCPEISTEETCLEVKKHLVESKDTEADEIVSVPDKSTSLLPNEPIVESEKILASSEKEKTEKDISNIVVESVDHAGSLPLPTGLKNPLEELTNWINPLEKEGGNINKKSPIVIPKKCALSKNEELKLGGSEGSSEATCSTVSKNEAVQPTKKKTEKVKLVDVSSDCLFLGKSSKSEEKELAEGSTDTATKKKRAKSGEKSAEKKIHEDGAVDPNFDKTSFHEATRGHIKTCLFDYQDNNIETAQKLTDPPCNKIIGVIGCGAMAKEIINCLITYKLQLKVWNRTIEKLYGLPSNVEITKSPADLITKCDFVLSCVSDENAVKEVICGTDGILKGLSMSLANPQKKGYVEMSSLKSDDMIQFSEEVQGKGGLFLDAQIQGSKISARFGSLTLVSSGDRTLFEMARPVFAALAHRVFYIDTKVGRASDASSIATSIHGMAIASLANAVNLMKDLKVEPHCIIDLFKDPLDMPILHAEGSLMLQKDNSNGEEKESDVLFPLGHLLKNLNNVLEAGEEECIPMMFAQTAADMMKDCIREFSASHDASNLVML